MISNAVIEALKKYSCEENIHILESMAAHTTFKVGGPADCLIEIDSEEQFINIHGYLKKLEMPFVVLGNGSNVLVSDKGYRGVVLQISKKFSDIKVEGCIVKAKAGAMLSQVARAALENSLTGFEFASGIPGTVGGAIVMNAGAYDGEMKQIVKSVKVLTDDGEILELDNDTMEFGYRTSVIKSKPFTVLEATFELRKGEALDIKTYMEELSKRRREKQPVEYPSAGSTFKRPAGHFAGKLIMDSGLKGYRVGGAQVSEKHCGFVINEKDATASDIMQLIKDVQNIVKEHEGIDLEPEVVFLGDF